MNSETQANLAEALRDENGLVPTVAIADENFDPSVDGDK